MSNDPKRVEPLHDHEAYHAINILHQDAVVSSNTGAAQFALVYSPLHQVKKFARLDILVGRLLKEFKKDSPDIKIYPCLKIDDGEPLDIYIKVSQKANILISIRSKSKSRIIYDEEKQWIYSRRRNRGRSRWKNCPMEEMNRYVKWLTKNREIFNLSSRQLKRVQLIRIIVIWSPTKIAKHDSESYCYMKGENILILKKRGKVYLMGEDKVVDFIKACLANEIKWINSQ